MSETPNLVGAPLPDALRAEWAGYLHAVRDGRREQALAGVRQIVTELGGLDAEARERFGHWLCTTLFDRSEGWNGRFGGGLTFRNSHYLYDRPMGFALSTYPLTSAVVVPHVVAHAAEGGRFLRWLYQCHIGLYFRLTPDLRAELDAALAATCGQDAVPLTALEQAARSDERARVWLAHLDD
jgi:hypothetical protein